MNRFRGLCMAGDDPTEQVALMRGQLDEKRKVAKKQLSTSKERLQDSAITETSAKNENQLELRELLNKLRLAWRSNRLVQEDADEKETT